MTQPNLNQILDQIEARADDNLLSRVVDLHRQATTERSHYYTAHVLRDAIPVISDVPALVQALRLCLPEIEGKEFVAACVDDGISPELSRLWKLRKDIIAILARSQSPAAPGQGKAE